MSKIQRFYSIDEKQEFIKIYHDILKYEEQLASEITKYGKRLRY
jgi:hypothetical protein